MTKIELNDKAAHYLIIVEWSDEDGCFVGSTPPLISYCAKRLVKA